MTLPGPDEVLFTVITLAVQASGNKNIMPGSVNESTRFDGPLLKFTAESWACFALLIDAEKWLGIKREYVSEEWETIRDVVRDVFYELYGAG